MQDLAATDIVENTLRKHDGLLELLLIDRTRTTTKKTHNILWATDSYSNHKANSEIRMADITGINTYLIQPRIAKSKEEQKSRTKDKAEVFTPREIVSRMNQQADWTGGHWPVDDDNWQDYVSELRLEITCGEAPFIVGRYNAVNGKKVLKLGDRVGFLDRKLLVVSKYCDTKKDWIEWAVTAFESSYGYEWQGDNLLLARENLLYTFVDYWNDKFPSDKINLDRKIASDKYEILIKVAEIISWNIFQMDGIKYVIPMSCSDPGYEVLPEVPPMIQMLFPDEKIDTASRPKYCEGCFRNEPTKHDGKYVKIMDWRKNKAIKFVDLIKGKANG